MFHVVCSYMVSGVLLCVKNSSILIYCNVYLLMLQMWNNYCLTWSLTQTRNKSEFYSLHISCIKQVYGV